MPKPEYSMNIDKYSESTGHGALMITGDTHIDLAGQMTLLNEWVANSSDGKIASRDAMKPAQFISELAYISVLEKIDSDLFFRLSGSEIRKMLGRETKGHRLVQFPKLANSQSGVRAIKTAFASGQPVSGTDELDQNTIHFWLRLPVMDRSGEVTQLICHDRMIDHSMLEAEAPRYAMNRTIGRAA